MSHNARSALNQYNQMRAHSNIADATPHRLIQMLIDGALERIRSARGFMEARKTADKASQITKAVAIIEGLQQSLDMEKGGEIAANLDALYDYMIRRLTLANLDNRIDLLDEVTHLLSEIKEAWDAIPDILRREMAAQQSQSAAAAAAAPAP